MGTWVGKFTRLHYPNDEVRGTRAQRWFDASASIGRCGRSATLTAHNLWGARCTEHRAFNPFFFPSEFRKQYRRLETRHISDTESGKQHQKTLRHTRQVTNNPQQLHRLVTARRASLLYPPPPPGVYISGRIEPKTTTNGGDECAWTRNTGHGGNKAHTIVAHTNTALAQASSEPLFTTLLQLPSTPPPPTPRPDRFPRLFPPTTLPSSTLLFRTDTKPPSLRRFQDISQTRPSLSTLVLSWYRAFHESPQTSSPPPPTPLFLFRVLSSPVGGGVAWSTA